MCIKSPGVGQLVTRPLAPGQQQLQLQLRQQQFQPPDRGRSPVTSPAPVFPAAASKPAASAAATRPVPLASKPPPQAQVSSQSLSSRTTVSPSSPPRSGLSLSSSEQSLLSASALTQRRTRTSSFVDEAEAAGTLRAVENAVQAAQTAIQRARRRRLTGPLPATLHGDSDSTAGFTETLSAAAKQRCQQAMSASPQVPSSSSSSIPRFGGGRAAGARTGAGGIGGGKGQKGGTRGTTGTSTPAAGAAAISGGSGCLKSHHSPSGLKDLATFRETRKKQVGAIARSQSFTDDVLRKLDHLDKVGSRGFSFHAPAGPPSRNSLPGRASVAAPAGAVGSRLALGWGQAVVDRSAARSAYSPPGAARTACQRLAAG